MRLLTVVVLLVAIGAAAAGPALAQTPADPPWSVPIEDLAAAVECPDSFTHPEHEPVLLVHGTFATGRENFGWNYLPLLAERGFDACLVTYPDRGMGDQQVSAEYVAYAIQEVHRRSGSEVDVLGHSQGGVVPRWAIRYWPSVAAVVDDAVLAAPPSHGTQIAADADRSPMPTAPAFFQFDPDSQFVQALNAGDETPGDVSWTVLYSHLDELVQPSRPVPTAALDWGREGPLVKNIAVDELCPGRVVDHLTIGTTDRLSQELALDAFAGEGPADPARLAPTPVLCSLPDQYVVPASLQALVEQLPASMAGGFPGYEPVTAEPPLRPYAEAALAGPSSPAGSSPSEPATAPGEPAAAPGEPASEVLAAGAVAGRAAAGGAAGSLPATGGKGLEALAGALVAAALVARRLAIR